MAAVPKTLEEFRVALGRAILEQGSQHLGREVSDHIARIAPERACIEVVKVWGEEYSGELTVLTRVVERASVGGDSDEIRASIANDINRSTGGVTAFLNAAAPYLRDVLIDGAVAQSGKDQKDFLKLLLDFLKELTS